MNDEAVGPVVAAVLLLGLLTVVSAIWTASTLPDWITEREDEHREGAAAQLLGLRDDLEAAAIRDSRVPATMSLDLAPSAIPLLQPVSARGTLSLEPATGVATSFTDVNLLVGSGQLLGPASEVVPQSPGEDPVTYEDAQRLEGLLISLTATGTTASKSAWVTMEATDGSSTVRINMTHQNGVSCQNREVRLTVEVVGEPPRYDQAVSCGLGNNIVEFEVDMMDPQYNAAGALNALDVPFDIALVGGGESFDEAFHAIWWINAQGDQVIGTGSGTTHITVARQGQALTYDLRAQGIYEQDLILDAGGLVATQPDGAVVMAAPGFTLSGTPAEPRLDWTFLVPSGTGSREGTGAVAVTASLADHVDALFEVDAATNPGQLTFTSAHAAAWKALLDDHLEFTGLDLLASVATNGDDVTLDIMDGAWTIHLRIITADLEVV